ncbi:helix-turn-helix domain-containing protein [Chitinophaga sp. 22620]|uniref:helix-turn-helix domain-containing protein n=1 Tax=Chitinophaga sp. 22620 TaxID=3453952 RepID=UPI003F83E3DF
MNIGKAIRELRKEKGLSQMDLASKAGITQAALSRIEKSGVKPGQDSLKRISEVLEVPEGLIYSHAIEREDVPENKRELYDQLFPVIQNMIAQLAKK